MLDDFEEMYHADSPCCGEEIHWEWDAEELHFSAECSCMLMYSLKPDTAQIVTVAQDDLNEDDDE